MAQATFQPLRRVFSASFSCRVDGPSVRPVRFLHALSRASHQGSAACFLIIRPPSGESRDSFGDVYVTLGPGKTRRCRLRPCIPAPSPGPSVSREWRLNVNVWTQALQFPAHFCRHVWSCVKVCPQIMMFPQTHSATHGRQAYLCGRNYSFTALPPRAKCTTANCSTCCLIHCKAYRLHPTMRFALAHLPPRIAPHMVVLIIAMGLTEVLVLSGMP